MPQACSGTKCTAHWNEIRLQSPWDAKHESPDSHVVSRIGCNHKPPISWPPQGKSSVMAKTSVVLNRHLTRWQDQGELFEWKEGKDFKPLFQDT